MRLPAFAVAVLAAAFLTAGCGSSTGPKALTAAGSSGASPGVSVATPPLQPEATATAAGDIPDNQVFLVFRDAAAGYSIKVPEGWAQRKSGARMIFRDKNNIVRIVASQGAPPTLAAVQAELTGLPGARHPQRINVSGAPAVKAVYSTESGANAVTGKRVKLVVDRYYLWSSGRRAVVDLATPVGVDNVDAYRLMIESFRWR
jgi:hypothetical protein